MITVEDLPEIDTPWSTVGYLTFKRTYARKFEDISEEEADESLLDMNAPTEEFEDTVVRVINGCDKQFGCGFTQEEEIRLATYFLELKASVAGRMWWQAGTKTVDKYGLASMQNCAFTVVDHPIRPFTWCMDMLAVGAGVGYNIQQKHVDKIPAVKEWFEAPTRFDDGGADFIVPDSREGWVRLLGKTLKAAFLSHSEEKGTFTYSTQVIRGKGTPIKGFGGTASGPEDLVWGIGEISKILSKRKGARIRPIDALDIMNIIGYIIVAGNVRRSAQIAIGDPDDVEFLLAKRWDLDDVMIPKWRSMSNNSVACSDIDDLHPFFWEGYSGNGEPYGLINLPLSRGCGRLGETQYPDPKVEGYNPCAEQSLEPYETCCLAEVFLPNVESKEELMDITKLLYRINKHSLMLPSHHPETTEVVHRNLRMGIGLTGIMQALPEQLEWLDDVYSELRRFDEYYSKKNNLSKSIKLTTIKPSGTLSLLPGVTPGAHPGYARFMYRRISIGADNSLVKVCKDHGYPIEFKRNMDGTEDYGTVIVTFPFKFPSHAILADDVDVIQQLKTVKLLQTVWSDNSVSCSIYYNKDDVPRIKEYLKENYRNCHKSLSFLLQRGHGFDQAPYEEISEETYNKLAAETQPISNISSVGSLDIGDEECEGGACPIR
ncbi:MAG: hypothetical protein OEX12_00295 [Gammaproteobacteria bacterium]|nr:hypothetical protein [Gammaproteobacteria bacterium]